MRLPVTGGMFLAVRTVTHSWNAIACSRRSSGVDSDRCAIAAVSISAPPVSSTVIMKPRSTATSRTWRVCVTPPSLDIFSVSPSAAPRRWISSISCSEVTDSSSTIGLSSMRRTDMFSSIVGHGCSKV